MPRGGAFIGMDRDAVVIGGSAWAAAPGAAAPEVLLVNRQLRHPGAAHPTEGPKPAAGVGKGACEPGRLAHVSKRMQRERSGSTTTPAGVEASLVQHLLVRTSTCRMEARRICARPGARTCPADIARVAARRNGSTPADVRVRAALQVCATEEFGGKQAPDAREASWKPRARRRHQPSDRPASSDSAPLQSKAYWRARRQRPARLGRPAEHRGSTIASRAQRAVPSCSLRLSSRKERRSRGHRCGQPAMAKHDKDASTVRASATCSLHDSIWKNPGARSRPRRGGDPMPEVCPSPARSKRKHAIRDRQSVVYSMATEDARRH